MTVYVDGANIQADVYNPGSGRTHKSRWCHLFSDQIDTTELHEFASIIGLKRAWFQEGWIKLPSFPDRRDPSHDHYDVNITKRRVAVSAGAVEVDMYEAVAIWHAKREAWFALNDSLPCNGGLF